MNPDNKLCVKLIHCGNRNISNPDDYLEKSIFYMPMGLFSMASLLTGKGFDVEIIHLDLENTREIEEILNFDTLDAVGLGCHWANQGLVVMDTAKLIKKIKPGVFIFLGGYTASFFADEILTDYPAVDAVIKGDGEIPVVQLCDVLYKYKNTLKRSHQKNSGTVSPGLENVQNLAWRGTNNRIIFNDFSYVSTSREMDRFDFAAVDLLRNREYYRELCKYWTKFEPVASLSLFMLETGRGCMYTCTTCGGNVKAQQLINNRSKQVVRSIDTVISSIKKALGFGFSCFLACFEFEGSDEWYIKLFAKIKKEKLKVFFVYESWGIPSTTLIDTLSRGCEQALITISPETADIDLRRKNRDKRRFYTNRQLGNCLDYIKTKNNLKVQLYFGYFLPFDTADTVFNTIDYITKLYRKYRQLAEIIYMNFNTAPCSSLFLEPSKYKMTTAVRTFHDYINKLRENFTVVNEERPAMTLFSWPCGISEPEAVNLANKVCLFNNLFYFNQSMRYLVEKVDKTNILSNYLRTIDLSYAEETDLTLDKIKKALLNICGIHLPSDRRIIRLISEEYEQIASSPNLTSFYTLNKNTGAAGEEEKAGILLKIKESMKEIEAARSSDFDL